MIINMAKMDKSQKISVIIPMFNAEKTIGKCLEGLEKQTLKPLEVIIVDDNLIKNLKFEIFIENYKLKIENLAYISQIHKGAGSARNTGAREAKGEILAFTDADCVPEKNWLANITKAFSDSEVGAVGGGYVSGIDHSFWQRFCKAELNYRRRSWNGEVSTLVSANMAVRRDLFFKFGGFPEKHTVCEDMFLSFKISQKYKVIWLAGNGVKHHFKNSLCDFLKHQYFFGRESTYFFLGNPSVFLGGNHQGRSLHFAIGLSFLAFLSLILSLLFNEAWFLISVLFFSIHLGLYLSYLSYLSNLRFKFLELTKAYFYSYLRDLTCFFSFIHGFFKYLVSG